jgi:hypothetical protein
MKRSSTQRRRGQRLNSVSTLKGKVQRVIWRCWQSKTKYDEVKYLESLRKRNSPLLKYAASNP